MWTILRVVCLCDLHRDLIIPYIPQTSLFRLSIFYSRPGGRRSGLIDLYDRAIDLLVRILARTRLYSDIKRNVPETINRMSKQHRQVLDTIANVIKKKNWRLQKIGYDSNRLLSVVFYSSCWSLRRTTYVYVEKLRRDNLTFMSSYIQNLLILIMDNFSKSCIYRKWRIRFESLLSIRDKNVVAELTASTTKPSLSIWTDLWLIFIIPQFYFYTVSVQTPTPSRLKLIRRHETIKVSRGRFPFRVSVRLEFLTIFHTLSNYLVTSCARKYSLSIFSATQTFISVDRNKSEKYAPTTTTNVTKS